MNSLLLSADDKAVRTQITLTVKLKDLIEKQATRDQLSLSAYLRQAAILKLHLDNSQTQDLSQLAKTLIGSVKISNHPNWQTPTKINTWLKSLRQEWT